MEGNEAANRRECRHQVMATLCLTATVTAVCCVASSRQSAATGQARSQILQGSLCVWLNNGTHMLNVSWLGLAGVLSSSQSTQTATQRVIFDIPALPRHLDFSKNASVNISFTSAPLKGSSRFVPDNRHSAHAHLSMQIHPAHLATATPQRILPFQISIKSPSISANAKEERLPASTSPSPLAPPPPPPLPPTPKTMSQPKKAVHKTETRQRKIEVIIVRKSC
jgi:hypothetical protein